MKNIKFIVLIVFMLTLPLVASEFDLPDGFHPDREENFSPIWSITTTFNNFQSTISFRKYSSSPLSFTVYSDFELFDNASVSLATLYHETRIDEWNKLNLKIDTIVYIFRMPVDGHWGEVLAFDDNSGKGNFSKLSVSLEKGKYRILIRRRFESETFPKDYTPMVNLLSSCEGSGCKPKPLPARVCNSDYDWDCVIGEALIGEIDDRISKRINLNKVPSKIKLGIKNAIKRIENRSFYGTDYSAEVEGIFQIYRSQTDHTVIAYAVVGYGSGEPDYNESLIYGFDLNGNEIFEDLTDW